MRPTELIALEEISSAIDSVAYTLAYFRGFPSEDNMTLEKSLGRMESQITTALSCKTSSAARQWLSYALRELKTAREVAISEDFDTLGNILSDVRDYLENAISDKEHAADFISSPEGKLHKTNDSD